MSTEGGDRFVWQEDELCERTAKELLEDSPKRCSACRNLLTREELRKRSCLCATCAEVIDRDTEEALERLHYDDLGPE
jgi:hypothetical protein